MATNITKTFNCISDQEKAKPLSATPPQQADKVKRVAWRTTAGRAMRSSCSAALQTPGEVAGRSQWLGAQNLDAPGRASAQGQVTNPRKQEQPREQWLSS